MTRLTKAIKGHIIQNAIDTAGITEQFAQLRTRRATLAENIRLDFLGGEDGVKAINTAVEKVERQMTLLKNVSGIFNFRINSSYEVEFANLGGMRVDLQYNGDRLSSETNYSERVFKKPSPRYGEASYSAEHKFTKELTSIENSYKTLCDKESGLYHQIMATLNQFTTIKKLVEVWPEVKDLLPKEQAAKPNLPAVQVKDLNCLIGLPKE